MAWQCPVYIHTRPDQGVRPHKRYAVAHLGDIIIHSTTWVDHLFHLREVLSELCQTGLTAKPKKFHLGLTEAQYLGYRISRGLIQPQEKKIEAIKPFPTPTTKKQVHAFLGLADYYRQFIPNFSSVASPSPNLLGKWCWRK